VQEKKEVWKNNGTFQVITSKRKYPDFLLEMTLF